MSDLENQLGLADRLNNTLSTANERVSTLGSNLNNQATVANDFFSAFEDGSDALQSATESSSGLADSLMGVAEAGSEVSGPMGMMSQAALAVQKSFASVRVVFGQVYDSLKSLYNLFTLNFVYTLLGDNLDNVRNISGAAHDANEQLVAQLGRMPTSQARFLKFLKEARLGTEEYGRSMSSVFGIEAGEVMKGVLEKITELGVGADRFMNKMKGAAAEVMIFNEGLGVSMESIESLAYRFKKPGDNFGELAQGLVGGAQDLGLSIKMVGKNFDAAVKDVKNFGYMTNKELIATTLYATKLGVEMDELVSFADGFDTFESAAEKVGKLSTMFDIQLDTMDMVMAENPAEKLDLLSKALRDSGQSIDDILSNPREARYLAETLNMTQDQLQKLASADMDNFGFQDAFDAAEKAKSQLTEKEALNVLADEMKKLRNSMSGTNRTAKTFFGAIIEGFTTAAQKGGIFYTLTESYSKALGKMANVGAKAYNLVSGLFTDPTWEYDKNGKKIPGSRKDPPLAGLVQPFLDYFDKMSAAADKLIDVLGGEGGVFDNIRKILNGEDVPDFNIFDMILEPFQDVSKPNVLTPGVSDGLLRVATLVAEFFADAFRFIGTNAVKWIGKLFDQKTVEKGMKEEERTLGGTAMSMASTMLDAFGDMLSDLMSAGGGLISFLFGGSFNGKTIEKKDSLFGGMLATFDERPTDFVEPGMFSRIGSALLNAVANIFDPSGSAGDHSKVLDAAGAKFADKFDYVFALLQVRLIKALRGMLVFLRDFANAEIKRIKKTGTGDRAFGLYNPYYEILMSLTDEGQIEGIDSTLAQFEARAVKIMEDKAAIIGKSSARYAKVLSDSQKMGLGPNLRSAEEKLKDMGLTSLLIDGKDKSYVLEMNEKNIPDIIRHLRKTSFHALLEGADGKITTEEQRAIEDQIRAYYGMDVMDQITADLDKAKDPLQQSLTSLNPMVTLSTELMKKGIPAKYQEVGKDIGTGFIGGLNPTFAPGGSFDQLMAETMKRGQQTARDENNSNSPSMDYYYIGLDMADGMIAGFFGDDDIIPGSVALGFGQRFAEQMEIVSSEIEAATEDMANNATIAIKTKLGRVGQMLQRHEPMQVHVDHSRMVIALQMKVEMDSADVAVAMATSPGGSYFSVNKDRHLSKYTYSDLATDWFTSST